MESTKFSTNLEDLVSLDVSGADKESSAAVSLNPSYVWTKFILTDDKPNKNKQRIPKEEFSNIIKTGIFAPVKMKLGEINDDHDDAVPLGVITALKEHDNKIEGIAALWLKEREEDVLTIKDMVNKGNYPQLSWEIMYDEASSEEDGIQALKNTILRAVTLVGMPAYAGRTPIYAAASKSNNSEETVDELEKLTSRVAELEGLVKTREEEIVSLKAVQPELEELRSYKASIELEKANQEKFASIKKKFADANLNKSEEYFNTNKENLMKLEESALDFMIQELVAFSSKKEDKASDKQNIPNISAEDDVSLKDPKVLAEAVRKQLFK